MVALDGVLDSFYQEVYLDPESQVDVERLVQHVSPDGLENYLDQIAGEIAKYSGEGHQNYGKVAKRLYNIARILRRDADASYLRQLFDDPPARLYQVGGTMHALSEAIRADRLDRDTIVAQLAALEGTIADCYVGADRDEIIALVRRLPDMDEDELIAAADRIAGASNTQVSDYFRQKIDESPGPAVGLRPGPQASAPAFDGVGVTTTSEDELPDEDATPPPVRSDVYISADIESDGPSRALLDAVARACASPASRTRRVRSGRSSRSRRGSTASCGRSPTSTSRARWTPSPPAASTATAC